MSHYIGQDGKSVELSEDGETHINDASTSEED